MAKVSTAWAARDGSSSATIVSGDLLLENGSYLLQENSGKLVLEAILMSPKEDTLWDLGTAKADSAWSARDGNSIITPANANAIRVQQNGTDIRVMQNGTDIRITNESVVTPKSLTSWESL